MIIVAIKIAFLQFFNKKLLKNAPLKQIMERFSSQNCLMYNYSLLLIEFLYLFNHIFHILINLKEVGI